MTDRLKIDAFVTQWRDTGGSEPAETHSLSNGLRTLIGPAPPQGSRTDFAHNDDVFEHHVFDGNGDGTVAGGKEMIEHIAVTVEPLS